MAPIIKNKKNGKAANLTIFNKKEVVKASIYIDFPQEKEKVQIGEYTIRIATDVHGPVELSINKSEWKPCRLSCGYYWFDWFPQETGAQNISARVRPMNGDKEIIVKRKCQVVQ